MNQAVLRTPVAKESRRDRLLAAAPRLAELLKLEQLTPEIVAEAASVSEADFIAEFGTVGEYMTIVHQNFMEMILDRLIRETGQMRPGFERILRATLLQLDICLELRALRGLVVQARRQVPQVAEDLHQRNAATALMISLELKQHGCRQPQVIGRYWCQMVLEAAEIEAEAGGKVPEARQALRDFLDLWSLESSLH